MGKIFNEIDTALRAFIESQKVFFVATAPANVDGHVNLSPKGLDTLRILDPLTIAYMDFTGSGIETVAHLRENGRITIMVCAFEGPPRIAGRTTQSASMVFPVSARSSHECPICSRKSGCS
jgi:predicted pyridoxine 5'-phosphate oxidase superfamily flavin-nucleotide-binding protein